MTVWDNRCCLLGEGPLWHPERQQLFWFDILNHRMLSRVDGSALEWQLEQYASAAGWVDHDRLLIGSATQLFLFDLKHGTSETVAELEADNATTRSNDGRADPHGGFWIGTMSLEDEPHAGTIYRFYRGEVRALFHNISITNAICFAPDGLTALFTDSATAQLRQVKLDDNGWPASDPMVWLDLSDAGRVPDGAVIDAEGNVWLAEWGSAQVSCYGPDAAWKASVKFPATQISCPAFGGPGLDILFCTSARVGLSESELNATPKAGMTFQARPGTVGQREHRVIM